jgi:hypothetical protein
MNPPPLAARHLAALGLIVATGIALVTPRMARPISPDGAQSYLPMARRLLAEGFAFLQRPESIGVAPFAYAYPALLGAQEIAIRWTNVALFGVAIVLVFFAGRVAHSNRAGLFAAALLAASPPIHPYIADVLTEPPYIFLTAAWIASIASVVRGRFVAGTVCGGIALALAVFTRPAAMYLPIVMGALFLWLAWRSKAGERRIDAAIAAMHALALAIVGLYIARNAVAFGYPSVATGSGSALFFGVNTMVDGFDPMYYGLSFDEGSVTRGVSHLSIAGDRLLRGVALEELRDTSWPVLIEMWAKKGWMFLFVSSGEDGLNVPLLRAWRTAMVILAFAGVAWRPRSRLVIAAAAMAAYMWVVHLPVLYNHRYSVAIDLPLAFLAAVGLAESMAAPLRIGGIVIALVLGEALAIGSLANAGPAEPRLDRSHHELLWSTDAGIRSGSPVILIPITEVPGLDTWSHYVLTLNLSVAPQARGTPCPAIRLRYKALDEPEYPPERVVRIPIRADGEMHETNIGMAHPLGMNRDGVLRLELECGSRAKVEIGRIAISEPNRGSYYRERYLNRQKEAR